MRKAFKTIYDGWHFIDGIEFDTLEEAQDASYDILCSWMNDCANEDAETWNTMISECSVWVEQYVEDADDWSEVWSPSDAYLKEIGWVEVNEDEC